VVLEYVALISDFFDNNPTCTELYASAPDIKDKWFKGNNQVSIHYIRKVLQDEAKLTAKCSIDRRAIKYFRFGEDGKNSLDPDYRTGFPFVFLRQD